MDVVGPPGRFAGRRRELAGLRADIDRTGLDTLAGRKAPRSRVLLIAGRPGSGRTALAEAFIARVARDYPDGVLRAQLTAPDGEPVPIGRSARDLLVALGVGAAPGADEDELTEAWGGGGRRGGAGGGRGAGGAPPPAPPPPGA
ncbi:hypothetical protein AAHZ94_15955, partial [Streptomyces sp. HSW2009]